MIFIDWDMETWIMWLLTSFGLLTLGILANTIITECLLKPAIEAPMWCFWIINPFK